MEILRQGVKCRKGNTGWLQKNFPGLACREEMGCLVFVGKKDRKVDNQKLGTALSRE